MKVQASADSRAVTIQTAEFDATGRRIKKVVTNSGDLDATTVYLYDGRKIIETRDGSSNVVAQFIHGTPYIDELVMARITGKGDYDAIKCDALDQGLSHHPGPTRFGIDQPFGHHGLSYDPEIGTYRNRARQTRLPDRKSCPSIFRIQAGDQSCDQPDHLT